MSPTVQGSAVIDGVVLNASADYALAATAAAVTTARDFANANTAMPIVTGDLIGRGIGQTVFTIAPKSSTKLAPTSGTNQLYLLRSAPGATGKEWAGFTLLGTDQGSAYVYNGLVLDHTVKHHLHDVLVKAVPGYKNYPPGETFPVNLYRDTDTLVENVEIDGGGVSAAPIGTNSSIRPVYRNINAHDCPYSTVTFWDTDTITVDGLRSVNNLFGLNFENDRGPISISNAFLSPMPSNTQAMHVRIDSSLGDNPNMVFRNITWANGYGGGKTLRVMISDFYHDFTAQQNIIRNRQTSLPTFYAADGTVMKWADAGNSSDPAGRTKTGANGQVLVAPYVPPAHMADALADPTHWVVRHH